MAPDEVLARFRPLRRNRRGWSSSCPGPNHQHGDRNNSLSLALGDDGRVLVNCFARCKAVEIVTAVGLQLADLFPDGAAPRPSRPPARALSPLDQARRDVLHDARRQLARLDLDLYADADIVRTAHRLVRDARAVATRHGGRDDVWELLADVAALEHGAMAIEARLDGGS